MKKIHSLFIILFMLFSCNYKTKPLRTTTLVEGNLPKDIIAVYLKGASLKSIESGVDSFEIRKWYPFYYIDSFPAILERYYYKNGFRGEIYFFLNKKNKRIISKNELNDLVIVKKECHSIPLRFMDSIIYNYNIELIDSFDTKVFRETNEKNPVDDQTAQKVLFEQATSTSYHSAFISDPTMYLGINNSIDKYAIFARFTRDSLCLQDTSMKNWFEKTKQQVFRRDE